jgi:hypothetical protein
MYRSRSAPFLNARPNKNKGGNKRGLEGTVTPEKLPPNAGVVAHLTTISGFGNWREMELKSNGLLELAAVPKPESERDADVNFAPEATLAASGSCTALREAFVRWRREPNFRKST